MFAALALLLLVFHSYSCDFQPDTRCKFKNWENEYRMSTLEANLKATQQVLSDFLAAFTNNTRITKDVESTLLKSTEGLVNSFATAHRNKTITMQTRINQLNEEVAGLQLSLGEIKSELEARKNNLNDYVASQRNRTWSLKRVEIRLPKLASLRLNGVHTYTSTLPMSLPWNTRAVLISVYCFYWNPSGHAYLSVKINQMGNEAAGHANLINRHYDVQYNDFYYEVLLPWDTNKPEDILFKVTSSINDGGPYSLYTFKIVGYITA